MATPGGNVNGDQQEEKEIPRDGDERPAAVPDPNTGGRDEEPHVDLTMPIDDMELDKIAVFLRDQLDDDEGCVVDISEARTYGRYPLAADDNLPPASKLRGFPHGGLPNDSGFSSRMSEDSASLHRAVEVSELKKAVADVAHGDESADDADAEGA